MEQLLLQYQSCDLAGNENATTPCNVFLARALLTVYGIKDFTDPKRPGGFLSANDIADRVAIDEHWERIGDASQVETLKQAALDASNKLAVIAAWKNPEPQQHGHVALILPGELTATSWGPTPNSASFVLGQPSKSYIGLPLSRAFKRELRPQVLLYHRRPEP